MLYIDDVGNNTIRFSNTNGGGGTDKFLPNNMVARSDEIGRVWIANKDAEDSQLDCYKPTEITVSGTVYANAGHCVQALNALFAEEAVALATTTTTTAAITTTTTT